VHFEITDPEDNRAGVWHMLPVPLPVRYVDPRVR